MGCCGDDDEKEQGVATNRSCRDVLFLLLFLGYWGGMGYIAYVAFSDGDVNRLIYGIDKYGFTCGSKNYVNGTLIDLTDSTNLYYLEPLQLLDPVLIPYTKRICVPDCPGQLQLCNITDMPCTDSSKFFCPYYRLAEDRLYDRIPGLLPNDVQYWGALATITVPNPGATPVLNGISALGPTWASYVRTSGISTSASTISGQYYQITSQVPGQGPCYPINFVTKSLFNRCVPEIPPRYASAITAIGNTLRSVTRGLYDFSDEFENFMWSQYITDISRGFLIIIAAGIACGVLQCLFWMIVLRFLAGVMAWLTIIAVNLLAIFACLWCWHMAGYIGSSPLGVPLFPNLPEEYSPTESDKDTWFWAAIVMCVVAGIVLIITLLCITRIKIAIACIKVASQTIGAMPLILIFPMFPFIFEVGLILYWVSVAGLLYSTGDLTAHWRQPMNAQYVFNQFQSLFTLPSFQVNLNNLTLTTHSGKQISDDELAACRISPDCYLGYSWDNVMKWMFLYHFFGLLWTFQFIVGIQCVTMAGALAQYYWNRGDSSKMPAFPIFRGLKYTFRYHLGSICFGSFLIAIFQLIRFLLEYIDRKMKEITAGNTCAAWLMCCLKCCCWIVEQIVQFISRQAYIMVAIKGKNYCRSACRAVKLIVSNALRIAVINVVADVLIFLTKVGVAAGCGAIAFGFSQLPYYTDAEKYPDTYLSSAVGPIAVSVISGWFIAEIFFAVYELAIETIILCFCEDCDVNGGNPKHAPELLMEAMGTSHKDVEKGDKDSKGKK